MDVETKIWQTGFPAYDDLISNNVHRWWDANRGESCQAGQKRWQDLKGEVVILASETLQED